MDADTNDPWECATLGEAYYALRDYEHAAYYYDKFATSSSVDAFALSSATRQLEEVWRAPSSVPGVRCLAILKDAIIRKHGPGKFSLSVAEAEAIAKRVDGFETHVPGGKEVSLQLLKKLVSAATSVAWIKDEGLRGRGSGFLVRGRIAVPCICPAGRCHPAETPGKVSCLRRFPRKSHVPVRAAPRRTQRKRAKVGYCSSTVRAVPDPALHG